MLFLRSNEYNNKKHIWKMSRWDTGKKNWISILILLSGFHLGFIIKNPNFTKEVSQSVAFSSLLNASGNKFLGKKTELGSFNVNPFSSPNPYYLLPVPQQVSFSEQFFLLNKDWSIEKQNVASNDPAVISLLEQLKERNINTQIP